MSCARKGTTAVPTVQHAEYLPYSEEKDWWTSNIDGEQHLQAAETGIASFTETPLTSLCTLFKRAATMNANKPALKVEQLALVNANEAEDMMSIPKAGLEGINAPRYIPLKRWTSFTWSEYYERSSQFGLALLFLGLNKHDRTAIIADNHPYYAVSFMGSILSGGVAVPLDPEDTEHTLLSKLEKVQARVIVTDSTTKLLTIKKHIDQFESIVQIVTWGLPKVADITRQDGTKISVTPFNEFVSLGTNLNIDILEKAMTEVVTQGCCAILFTSGIIDDPRAVMISHDNLHYASVVNFNMMGKLGASKKQYKFFSYLPLSVVAFLLFDIIAPIVLTANISLKGWGTTHFARRSDLANGTLLYRVRSVRPIIFIGTPRVWTELMIAIQEGIVTRSSMYKGLLARSQGTATKLKEAAVVGSNVSAPCVVWEKRFLRSFHKYLGLNKAQFLMCKHGALPLRCSDFFDSFNLRINESYGLTESTGLGFMNTNTCFFPGSAGYEASGMESKILTESDVEARPSRDLFSPGAEEQGEILLRGRAVMMGYLDDHEANIRNFDRNGFLHTGDVGTKSTKGMTKIIGKLAELVNGLPPSTVEFFLKQVYPSICDAVVLSDNNRENILLLTLKINTDEPSDHQIAELRDIIEMTNSTTEIMKNENQHIKKFTILPRQFSVATGELSSNLRLKRRRIREIYRPIIRALYHEREFYVPYVMAPTEDLAIGSESGINPWSIVGDRRTIFANTTSQFSKVT